VEYIVYITDECKKEAETYSCGKDLDNLKRSVEEKQSIAMFNNFPPPLIVRKQFGSKRGRLIASVQSREVEGNQYEVVVFLAFLIKSDRNYDSFSKTGNREWATRRDDKAKEKIDNYIKKYKEERPESPKAELSSHEKSFLLYHTNNSSSAENDNFVYETEEWIEKNHNKTLFRLYGIFMRRHFGYYRRRKRRRTM
jgi:hypothetical protein